jgi:hypothetical protein
MSRIAVAGTVFKVQNDKRAVAILYMGLGLKIQSLLEIQIAESMWLAILNTIEDNSN